MKIINTEKFLRNLQIASVSYIILPYFIFAFGYLRYFYAIAFSVILFAGAFFYVKDTTKIKIENVIEKLNLTNLLIVFALSFVWVYLSGIGGYGHQNTDYSRDNTIMLHLVYGKWPVFYNFEGNSYPFVYNIAFYLLPGFAGKLFGWVTANHVWFIWGWVGVILTILWFLVLVRNFSFFLILVFIFFDGIDLPGAVLTFWFEGNPCFTGPIPLHLDGWFCGQRSFAEFFSTTASLFWVPLQAIPGWLITSMLIFQSSKYIALRNIFFLLSLTLLWAPFIGFGLIPYAVLLIIFFIPRFKNIFTFQNVISGLILVAVMAVFYMTKLANPEVHIPTEKGLKLNFSNVSSLFSPDKYYIKRIILLYFTGFILYGLAIVSYIRKKDSNVMKYIFLVTIAALSIFPFIRIDYAVDFAMKATIPALFILVVFIGRTLTNKEVQLRYKVILIIALTYGSLSALGEIGRALHNISDGHFFHMPGYNESSKRERIPESGIYRFLGDPNSFFFKYLARR